MKRSHLALMCASILWACSAHAAQIDDSMSQQLMQQQMDQQQQIMQENQQNEQMQQQMQQQQQQAALSACLASARTNQERMDCHAQYGM